MVTTLQFCVAKYFLQIWHYEKKIEPDIKEGILPCAQATGRILHFQTHIYHLNL